MAYQDLREFISTLEKQGEAVRINEEVDWNLEVGAIARRCHEQSLPSPFFQKIKDYPQGYRILAAPLSKYSRIAIAMGMDKNTSTQKLMEEYGRRTKKTVQPIMVKDGPCKENIQIGDKVDLMQLPVPYLHQGDGGRFIGTLHLTITKDLGSDWVNWGMYRHMLINKNTVGVHMSPIAHHGKMFYQYYESQNKPMEIAIAIGVEPISTFFAATALPYGVSEAEYAGALRGEPVEMIKCETIDLSVPATSEIVIEGEIIPHERAEEGPFGEYTGYIETHKSPRPVMHVKALTFRNNPILTVSCVGIPIDDNLVHSVSGGSDLMEALKTKGLPVTGLCIYPETSYLFAAVAVSGRVPNIAGEVATVVWSTSAGRDISTLAIVNDDVDPFDMKQVLHAMMTKCHPDKGVVKIERSTRAGLAPWSDAREKKYGLGSRLYFDCTWPIDWEPSQIPLRVSFKDSYPPDIQKKALDIWEKLGYKTV